MRSALLTAVALLVACGDGSPGEVGPGDDTAAPPAGDDAAVEPSPLRHLTHAELDRAVRDLLGADLRPSQWLPEEVQGEGFANDPAGQAVSALLVERWGDAARRTAEAALAPFEHVAAVEGEDLAPELGQIVTFDDAAGTWHYFDVDHTEVTTITVPLTATYEIALTATYFQPIYDDPRATDHLPRVEVRVDGTKALVATVDTVDFTTGRWALPIALEAGSHDVSVDIDVSDAVHVFVDAVRFTGPQEPELRETVTRAHLLGCDVGAEGVEACATETLAPLARRAWRAPSDGLDVGPLAGVVTEAVAAGDTYEDALALGLEALLLSPSFLFVAEADGPSEVHALAPHERATRLALFLWGSIPDAELLDCADAGGLGDTDDACGLSAQAARMLADPRSAALVDGFVTAWLGTGDVPTLPRDPSRFPTWDPELAAAMKAETDAFVADLIARDAPMGRLLDAPFTYVNDRLAQHYGLPTPGSHTPTRVEVGPTRSGLLRHGSVLATTSHPTGHSYVLRGVWILRQLLCDPPDAAPANVPSLDPDAPPEDALGAHAANPACASCHDTIDPMGKPLDGYDAVGLPVPGRDVVGALPDGTTIDGPDALVAHLQAEQRFDACLTEHLTAWALARTVQGRDRDALAAVTQQAASSDFTWSSVIDAIVRSEAFTLRREEAP